jgi:hypothetical protein
MAEQKNLLQVGKFTIKYGILNNLFSMIILIAPIKKLMAID